MPAKTGKATGPGVVGQNVRRLREAATPPLSRAALARRSGISASTISNIELGYIDEPSVDTVRRLAAALDVTDRDLLAPHGHDLLEDAIEVFLASDYSRRMPGGPVTDAELAWLRRFDRATWENLPPNPEALQHLVLARRMNPDLQQG